MASNFPTSLDTLTNPISTDSVVTVSHASQHTNANDILEAIEAKVGIDSSAVTTSHDYKLSGVTGTDKAASLTGTETLTNKTLTSPTITLLDVNFTVQDNADTTKQAKLELSGITTGTTRTLTVPDATGTIALIAATQTLTNKTIDLTSNTLTSTLAQLNTAVSDADVASLAGTETLTNKTLTAPKLASGGFIADANGNEGVILVTTASAVNEITVTNAATGNAPKIAASGETNVDLQLDSKGTGTIKPQHGVVNKVSALTDGANIATDASLGNIFTVTLGGNRTMDNPTNSVDGQVILYKIKQDGTGSRTITWGANFRGSTDVALPTLTTTANAVDYVLFYYNSAVTKWDCLSVNKGFAS